MDLLFFTVAVVLVFLLLYPSSRKRQFGGKIPGPRAYPIVGNIFNFRLTGARAVKDWEYCVKKFGNTFRYWIGSELFVFVSEPEDMQKILTSPTLITKSVNYNVFSDWLGTGLLISTGRLWQRRRKAITPTFHFKILETFVPTFNKCANVLVDCLKDKVGKGPFELIDYMSVCALDAIAETAMGTEIKAQTNPKDEYPESIIKMGELLADKICNPFSNMEPFYTFSGKRKLHADLLNILFSLPLEVIKRKENDKSVNNDSTSSEVYGAKKKTAFLELLLKMKQSNEPAFETDQDIKDEVVTFMFEGHDTTTMALTYTIWLLGLHPQIQEDLFNEVHKIIGDHKPCYEDYQKMNYLDRVIKESLRLYPPVPTMSRMVTEDIVLPASGYLIPAGTQVGMFVYSMHRRADLFPQPELFNPDRFLEPQKHPFAYLPFSAGLRNCIGQKFAMLDLKVIISNLVLNYKIHSPQKEVKLKRELILRCVDGPVVSLTLRN